ncbi:hypothetical protein DL767_002746 [Monosporascus sp. MG133]|nr:hypothetical protein DL767_002746 [Monosporascus sp. MG133]
MRPSKLFTLAATLLTAAAPTWARATSHRLTGRQGTVANETTKWGAVCQLVIIPVHVTKSVEGNFSMEDYDVNILFALAEREILIEADYELSARYCQPGPGVERKDTLQILAHGATFNKVMWDFPYKPESHSWTRFMTLSGYSTLAVDLVGAGNSTHPHGLLEAQTETYVQTMHHVIQKVRSRELLDRSYAKIALVGFSIGAITSNAIADRFPEDADAIILIGIAWELPYIYPSFLAGLQSAANTIDPDRWGHLESFYQTQSTLAAREVANFGGDYDVGALEADYATRDLDTLGAAVTFTYHLVTAPSYKRPVFLGIGNNDASFCGRKCGSQPYALYDRFPAASDHVVKVYENTGHAILYHNAAPALMKDARDFLEKHLS